MHQIARVPGFAPGTAVKGTLRMVAATAHDAQTPETEAPPTVVKVVIWRTWPFDIGSMPLWRLPTVGGAVLPATVFL